MKNRICLGLLGLLLMTPISVFAQTAENLGLVLKVKSPCNASRNYFEDYASFGCSLKLEFQNTGSSPVVLINPSVGYGSGLKDVIYYYNDFNLTTRKSKIIGEGRVNIGRSELKQSELKAMAELFDGERPPENFTIILQPNETFEFNDSAYTILPLKTIEPEKTQRMRDPETGKVRSYKTPAKKVEPHCFRLIYEYSFLPFVENPDFLVKLNLKWKRYGQMPIGTNGTYTVTSELFSCVVD